MCNGAVRVSYVRCVCVTAPQWKRGWCGEGRVGLEWVVRTVTRRHSCAR